MTAFVALAQGLLKDTIQDNKDTICVSKDVFKTLLIIASEENRKYHVLKEDSQKFVFYKNVVDSLNKESQYLLSKSDSLNKSLAIVNSNIVVLKTKIKKRNRILIYICSGQGLYIIYRYFVYKFNNE